MSIKINTGTILPFVMFAVLMAVAAIFTYLGKKGKTFELRKLAAIEAIDDGIGRAVEMGKPILFDFTSRAQLAGAYQLETMCTMSALQYIMAQSAKLGANLIVMLTEATQVPLVADMGRTVYSSEGKPGGFTEANIRYHIGSNAKAVKRDCVMDLQPATLFAIGPQSGTDFHYLEGGMEQGVFQVGGTARALASAFFVVCCDYSLIMEEEFVAGAYLSKDPDLLCTVAGGDAIRYGLFALIIMGSILSLVRITTLSDILKR